MSQVENKWRPLVIGLVLVLLLSSAFFGVSSSTTIPAQQGDQIKFHTAVSGNGTSTATTKSWSAIANETMVVSATIGLSTLPPNISVSSVTDLLGDTFTRRIQQFGVANSLDANAIEIWTGTVKASLTNAVTVTWNVSSIVNAYTAQVATYTGVGGVGNTNSTTSASGISVFTPLTLINRASGSWVIGASNVVNPSCPPSKISSGPGFIQRIETCDILLGSGANEAEISDNATALRNLLKTIYSPVNSGTGSQTDQAIMELMPVDAEPLTPDFNTFCSPLQGSSVNCLNFAGKTSGANVAANIVVGTTYCTGITTVALVMGGAHNLQALAQYAGQSRNDTGAIILIEVIISTTAPPTTFGSCSTPVASTVFGVGKIFFATSGATLTQFGLNEYATAVNSICVTPTPPCNTASTVYASIDILPQSVGAGNLGSTIQYAQWGSGLQSSSLSMIEIK